MKRILVTVLAATAVLTGALAQNIKPVTVRFVNAPAKKALANVFDQMGVRYEVQPDVKGNVTFEAVRGDSSEVLYEILDQAGAIAEFRDGSYTIRAIKRSKSSPNLNDLVSLDYQHADIRLVARELLGDEGARYTLGSEVRGCVYATLKSIKLADALRYLLSQVDAYYAASGGKIQVLKRPYSPPASMVPPPSVR